MRRVAIVGAGMTPFAEHFDLGIKDLVPMAVTEMAARASTRVWIEVEIEAAWFGELSTTDGFPSGILADSCGLLDIPVTHVENACATGQDALRNASSASPPATSTSPWWWEPTRFGRPRRARRSGTGWA